MQSGTQTASVSKGSLWAGRIITGLFGLFMLFDGVMKLVKPPFVVEGTRQAGFPESSILGLGIVLSICSILYLIPRTSILGAILLTGYSWWCGGHSREAWRRTDSGAIPGFVWCAVMARAFLAR